MSYDLGLVDPQTKEWIRLPEKHHMRGGTYCIGGEPDATFNITYNYSSYLHRVLDGGIRSLYGMTGRESIPILTKAINQLADDQSDNYWEATEGNTRVALEHCRTLAEMCPDGIWEGD